MAGRANAGTAASPAAIAAEIITSKCINLLVSSIFDIVLSSTPALSTSV